MLLKVGDVCLLVIGIRGLFFLPLGIATIFILQYLSFANTIPPGAEYNSLRIGTLYILTLRYFL